MYNQSQNTTVTCRLDIMGVVWFTLGACCSWVINHSVMWAIIHGMFGPFYLLYLCGGCGGGFDAVDEALRPAPTAQEYTIPPDNQPTNAG